MDCGPDDHRDNVGWGVVIGLTIILLLVTVGLLVIWVQLDD